MTGQVIPVQRLAELFADAVARTGGMAPAILFLATFLEYVVPPVPGDVVVVLGAWYAVHGQLSWPATFASVTAGALAGAWVDYRIGAALGRDAERRAARRGSEAGRKLARFEASYRRWGGLLLLGNRFMPGIRGFVFYAAGASGIPLRKVLVLGGVSSALWNAALLAAGALLAENVNELASLVERYTRVVSIALVAVALAAAGVLWLRRRRGTRPSAEEP